jgi:hypothetical protein
MRDSFREHDCGFLIQTSKLTSYTRYTSVRVAEICKGETEIAESAQ